MTAVTTASTVASTTTADSIAAPDRRASLRDVVAIAGRALRAVPRDLESVIPPVFIALFFFVVNVGTLQNADRAQHRELRLPSVHDADRDPARRHRRVARAGARARHTERLLRPAAAHAGPPAGHPARAHGCRRHRRGRAHGADPHRSGSLLGVRFEAGPLGIVVFIAIAALWSLAFAGSATRSR